MMMSSIFFRFPLLLYCLSVGALEYSVVDLTHVLSNESIHWPTTSGLDFYIDHRDYWRGLWYESNSFKTDEHIGTHIDAPAHLYKGSWRIHEIPVSNLVGPGVVINIKDKAVDNVDYRVTQADFESWESNYGRIPNGAVVLLNSGWDVRYPDKASVFNSSTPNDATTFHFPSWHEDAIQWLVSNRKVHVVGVDTPSNDYGPSQNYPAHVILGKHNIPGVENVANLDQIPEHGSIVFVSVMKLLDGSGGPARVMAMVPKETSTAAVVMETRFVIVIFVMISFCSKTLI